MGWAMNCTDCGFDYPTEELFSCDTCGRRFCDADVTRQERSECGDCFAARAKQAALMLFGTTDSASIRAQVQTHFDIEAAQAEYRAKQDGGR